MEKGFVERKKDRQKDGKKERQKESKKKLMLIAVMEALLLYFFCSDFSL